MTPDKFSKFNIIKRLFAVILIFILILDIACLFSSKNPELDKNIINDSVTVYANNIQIIRSGIYDNPPKIFVDENGNASGFWIDILEYIASREGWKIEYVYGTWEECLESLKKNDIDIMPDVAFTEERAVLYDFSKVTVYSSWSRIYAKRNNDISSILNLEGKNVAVLKGSVNVEGPEGIKSLTRSFDINCKFTEVGSYIDVFKLVASGEADAGVSSKDFGHKNADSFNLIATPIIFAPSLLYFAFPRGSNLSPYLMERIDANIKELKEKDGSIYYQALEKWFGIKLSSEQVIPHWIFWMIISVSVLALLLTGAVFLLRRQVAVKTKHLVKEINKRKETEKALKESEERYRYLLENSEVGISIVKDGMIKFTNRKVAEITGYSVEELESISGFEIIHPDDRERLKDYHAKRMQGEEAPLEYTFRIIDRTGNVKWLDRKVKIIMWEGETAVIVFDTDITERKRMEDERRQMELKAQITNRLVSIGQLAAGVAHEINNPLTGVIGFAQLLAEREDLPDDIKRDIKAIYAGAQRVAGIVKRLLIFSRQIKPQRKHVNINELVENTLILRSYHLRVNNIKVNTLLAPDLPVTIADPGQIQQVLLNLIINAETEMKIAHGRGKLTIKTERSNNNIKIYVKDSGPGIRPEIIDRIFEPFFTTREEGQGTGLGLSLCHGIITEHNGWIYVESEQGKGATFIVELPIIEEAEIQKIDERIEEVSTKKEAKILVVDDEAGVCEFLNKVLCTEGCQVDIANTATEALEKIRVNKYDLLLIDIKMPDMNGIELYKHIKKINNSLIEKIMLITGDVMDIDTAKFLDESNAPYIEKPFDLSKLKIDIKRALAR